MIAEMILDVVTPVVKKMVQKIVDRQEDAEELARDMLTGRLVYLLRCMDEHCKSAYYPKYYAEAFASFKEEENPEIPPYDDRTELVWTKATQYACSYLSVLGLVETYGGLGGEVKISPLGSKVIRSDAIRDIFNNCFKQKLAC